MATKRGRPKGSKNRAKAPVKARASTSLPSVPKGRFVVEVVQDEIASILYRELKISAYYLRDTHDGLHGRMIARFFDERLAALCCIVLNGSKRVAHRLREQLEEEENDSEEGRA